MSVVHKFTGNKNIYDWDGVVVKAYEEEFTGVTRQVLIGEQDKSPNYEIRYFRLEPGSHSHKEQHPHDHGVVILHGRAKVQINETFQEVGPLDVIYISGNDLHQFVVLGSETLGFLCTVPANR